MSGSFLGCRSMKIYFFPNKSEDIVSFLDQMRCLAVFNVSGGREVTERQLERAMAYVNLVYNRSGWSVTAGHLRYMNTKDPFGLCCVLLK